MQKTCKQCGATKNAPDDFYRGKNRPDGLYTYCRECVKAARKRHQIAARDAIAARKRETRSTDSGRAKISAYNAAYYAANKPLKRALARKWIKANPAYNTHTKRMYALAARQAVPPWADRKATAEVYRRARELRDLGFDVHVDHVFPIRGEDVCGLHWHGNLEIIDGHENKLKGNRTRAGVEPLYSPPQEPQKA